MTLKLGFEKLKTDNCLLYRVNELGTVIVIVHIYGTLEIGEKPASSNTIERTKKEYATQSMGELEDFVGCMIKRELTKTTLNISQPYLITNMTQGFNKDMKSLIYFNTASTPHKGIVPNKETYTKISYNIKKRYRSGVGLHSENCDRIHFSN